MTWAENLFDFYNSLQPPLHLPPGISWLYPQKEESVLKVVKDFLYKYYDDKNERTLLLGINPGRYGAGVTGVNFTAPKQLTEELKIPHPFKQQSELSAEFIYKMINKFGGPDAFFGKYFITSVCPLGFVEKGKNINYYDNKELMKVTEPFIIDNISKQAGFNINHKKCFCIGGEKNYKFLSALNSRHQWFKEIIPLAHPRFIMQYKRKLLEEYVDEYVTLLSDCSLST